MCADKLQCMLSKLVAGDFLVGLTEIFIQITRIDRCGVFKDGSYVIFVH